MYISIFVSNIKIHTLQEIQIMRFYNNFSMGGYKVYQNVQSIDNDWDRLV